MSRDRRHLTRHPRLAASDAKVVLVIGEERPTLLAPSLRAGRSRPLNTIAHASPAHIPRTSASQRLNRLRRKCSDIAMPSHTTQVSVGLILAL